MTNGINALDLFDEPISQTTLANAKVMLEQNFGVEYDERKWLMLVQMVIDENWTEERFKQTFKWFLKNKRFGAWTIADWFDYGIKLYPIQWMNQKIHEMGNPPRAWEKFDRYRINGVVAVKLKDGVELPFEKIQ